MQPLKGAARHLTLQLGEPALAALILEYAFSTDQRYAAACRGKDIKDMGVWNGKGDLTSTGKLAGLVILANVSRFPEKDSALKIAANCYLSSLFLATEQTEKYAEDWCQFVWTAHTLDSNAFKRNAFRQRDTIMHADLGEILERAKQICGDARYIDPRNLIYDSKSENIAAMYRGYYGTEEDLIKCHQLITAEELELSPEEVLRYRIYTYLAYTTKTIILLIEHISKLKDPALRRNLAAISGMNYFELLPSGAHALDTFSGGASSTRVRTSTFLPDFTKRLHNNYGDEASCPYKIEWHRQQQLRASSRT